MARFAAHLGLVLLGCALALVGLETALQVASLAARTLGQRAERLPGAAGRRILCVGDSHTYGTSVSRAESYPVQLEAYLNRVDPEGRYRVVNRGVPGMNSTQLAGILPLWLGQSRSDLAVVWIGSNNVWNRARGPMGLDAGDDGGLRALLARSRLLRLVQTIRLDAAWRDSPGEPEPVATRIVGDAMPWLFTPLRSREEFFETTLSDLSRIELALERSRVEWLLVTYPQTHPTLAFPAQKLQARAVQRFRSGRSIAVVDTALDLSRALAAHPEAVLQCVPSTQHDSPCLLVNEMGPHPTGLLYGFIAESIGRAILERLGCAGPCELEPRSEGSDRPAPSR